MWFYVDFILRAHQIVFSAAHNIPRGNLSDLYPRWLGTHELLLHHRNPYSPEITREIQQGFYGRPLDPARPEDPKDQQGFVYPVYVVFLLAPTVGLPFNEVMVGFRWFLIALAPVSMLLWLRVVRWKPSLTTTLIFIALAPGWWPMIQGIKLQQLSLLVAALLAACGACLTRGWYFLAGGLLAVATIKPQLAWPLALWLLVWAASGWRTRRQLIFGFVLGMALLLMGAELILPGWLGMFLDAIGRYRRYTQNQSVLAWDFGLMGGRFLGVLGLFACALRVWRVRRKPAASADFGQAFALVLALTVVIVPTFSFYNQVLLIPAILVLLQHATSRGPILPAIRLAGVVSGMLVSWSWIAAMLLSAVYIFLSPQLSDRFWGLPLYADMMTPIFIFALALMQAWITGPHSLRDGALTE
jgi:Glycosyltransferase family 87